MYYKLYIDSVFFIQFVMNLYLLSITGKVLKCTATHRRIFLGALVGAGMICLVILLPVWNMKIRLFCGIIPVSMCMMRMVFGMQSPAVLVKSSMVMGGCGFFFGSIVSWLTRRLAVTTQWQYGIWTISFLGYLSYIFVKFFMKRMEKEKQSDIKGVRIPTSKKEVHIKALLDTGNHLAEPISGAPVCIISESVAKELSEYFLPEHYHAIPYRSIGKKSGILNAYELPEITIEDSYREIYCKCIIVAICNTGISKDSIYQMILHPQLLDN